MKKLRRLKRQRTNKVIMLNHCICSHEDKLWYYSNGEIVNPWKFCPYCGGRVKQKGVDDVLSEKEEETKEETEG